MIKKIIFFILFFSSFAVAGNSNFSDIASQIRKKLPDNLETYYAEKESYFKLGHFIAKNYEINTDVKNLYDKIISGIKTNNRISNINAVYYGVFEYLIIEDFFKNSSFSLILQNNEQNCPFTGIETYDNSSNFFTGKETLEHFLKIYSDAFNSDYEYRGFSEKYFCEFNEILINLHATILGESGLIEKYIFLKANSSTYYPSDRIIFKISTTHDDNYKKAFAIENGDVFYFYDGNMLTRDFSYLTEANDNVVLDTVLPEFDEYKTFSTYAGIEPFDVEYSVSSVNVDIKNPFNINIDLLEFAPVLLGVYENYIFKGAKQIQPFDFIFVGGFPDDPLTEEDESSITRAIPGEFSHTIIYLGRLPDGTPLGAEMTTTLEEKEYSMRLIKLPEVIDENFDSSAYDLPLVTVNIYKYKNVNAKRLKSDYLQHVLNNKYEIYSRVLSDIYESYPYQFQFYWSGNLDDKNIYLIDDGLKNGAACTDYWLLMYEELSGICIKGSRMGSDELIDYFTNDPIGSTIKVPDSFNPFNFDVYIKNIVGLLGFNVVNPEPHIFSCDNFQETGITTPSKLYYSIDLQTINFVRTN